MVQKKLSVSELAARINEETGFAIHPTTIHLWVKRGLRGVRLAAEYPAGKCRIRWRDYKKFERAVAKLRRKRSRGRPGKMPAPAA